MLWNVNTWLHILASLASKIQRTEQYCTLMIVVLLFILMFPLQFFYLFQTQIWVSAQRLESRFEDYGASGPNRSGTWLRQRNSVLLQCESGAAPAHLPVPLQELCAALFQPRQPGISHRPQRHRGSRVHIYLTHQLKLQMMFGTQLQLNKC